MAKEMKVNIDLGTSYDDMKSPMMTSEPDKTSVMYPSFNYDGDTELEIPDEGVMTIRYCVRRESESTDSKGDKHYSCSIDVEEIVSVEEGPDENSAGGKDSGKETSDALDTLLKAVSKKY